jgi:two-component system, OmpR family, alkaline phosphatase synthesis response regulator PhoP
MSRILLVEDDELVGTMVRMNLENSGHELRWCRDGIEAEAAALDGPYDLVLLDISLPGQDGYAVLRSMRQAGVGTPVLMLTARSDVGSKVMALDQGADDYLAKPFDIAELVARVRALVRRSTAERQLPASRVISFDRYRLDLDSREAETNEGCVVLAEKEAEIMALLVRSDGAVLSRADIIEEVWGLDAFPVERTVDNYLVRLRKLFEPDPRRPRHILTVRGAGFRFLP